MTPDAPVTTLRLSRAFARAGIAQALTIGAGIAAQLVLARGLGAEERGRLGFQLAVVFMGSQLLSLGLHWGLAIHVARRNVLPAAAAHAALIQAVIAGAVYTAAALLLSPLLRTTIHVSRAEAVIGGAVLGGMAAMSAAAGLLNAAMKLDEYNRAIVIWRVVPVILLLALWVWGALTVGTALVTNAAASWVSAMLALRRAFRGALGQVSQALRAWVISVPDSLRALASNAFVYIQQRLDVVMAAVLLPAEAAGTYAVLAAAAELAISPAQSIGNVLFASLASGARSWQAPGVIRSLGSAVYVGVAAAILFGVLCPIVFPWLMGPTFDGWEAARALAPGIGTAYLGVALHAAHTARGYPLVCSVAPAAGSMSIATVSLLLASRHGVTGIAAAAAAGHAVRGALLWIVFAKRMDVGLRELLTPWRVHKSEEQQA